jgi:hydroxypyruvate isomerase
MSRILCTRRSALKLGAGTLAAAGLSAAMHAEEPLKAKGRIKQSVCRWCYGSIALEKLAEAAKGMGYQSIELLTPEEYQVVKPLGLTCAMLGRVSITDGLNRQKNHAPILKELRRVIDFAAAENIPNVICMAGNRAGLDDQEGLDMCAVGLKEIVGHAEKMHVTICMEGLNSKLDHKDYMYDKTEWGVKLCQKVGSERFKLLYDIYHMQIMEGDVINTIRKHKDYIAHYHTGGNPGRHEIDETQELNYPAIVKAIIDTGYKGFLGQEFIPVRDKLTSLAQGFRICDV